MAKFAEDVNHLHHCLMMFGGDVHLAVFCDCPWAVAIPFLRVPAWKNAMGSMKRCVALIHGAHGK